VYDIDEVSTGLLLNIRANTNPEEVGSVVMSMTGPFSRNHTENVAPYALFGNIGPDYNGASFPPGNYNLTATAYTERAAGGEMGAPNTIEFTLAFRPMAVASSSTSTAVEDIESISFTGSNSTDDNGNNDLIYAWNFGDGSTSSEMDPTHLYEEPGEYTVNLVVTNEFGLTDETSLAITVTERTLVAPRASISFTGINSLTGPAPLAVGFIGSGSEDDIGIVTYEWDFGDGFSATGEVTEHTFETPGEYMVSLTVTDTDGLTDSAQIPFTITEPGQTPPQVLINYDNSYGVAPVAVSFTSELTTAENGIAGYLWDFGDGTTSTEANPTHVYTTPGEYRASLEVTDNIGLVGESSGLGIRVADPSDDIYFLILVNTQEDEDIFALPENLNGLPLTFNDDGISVRAHVNEAKVESVRFELTGPVQETRVENVTPYALFGDIGGDYFTKFMPEGSYTLTATTFYGNNATGTQGQSMTVSFTLVDYSLGAKGVVNNGKDKQNELSLFPNMARDEVSLSFSEAKMEIREIAIYDMTGKKVAQYEPSGVSTATGYQLPLETLPAGMYVIKTTDKTGAAQSKLLGIKK
jgi:PKD repeat protein